MYQDNMEIHSQYRKLCVEIDTDSDEFQAWYLAFTSFPPSALLESQAKLNEIVGRHFEDTNQTGRKKHGPLYAVGHQDCPPKQAHQDQVQAVNQPCHGNIQANQIP
jgi:hypothetical protein